MFLMQTKAARLTFRSGRRPVRRSVIADLLCLSTAFWIKMKTGTCLRTSFKRWPSSRSFQDPGLLPDTLVEIRDERSARNAYHVIRKLLFNSASCEINSLVVLQ